MKSSDSESIENPTASSVPLLRKTRMGRTLPSGRLLDDESILALLDAPERKEKRKSCEEEESTSHRLEDGVGVGPEAKMGKTQIKAAREKARREKMNERFTLLAELSNAEDPKNDKASILMDSIRAMKALQLENDQLKQLNKFLEEKVTVYEKERSLALYQQSFMFNGTDPQSFPFNQGLFPGNVGSSLLDPGLDLHQSCLDFGEDKGDTVLGTPLETKDKGQNSVMTPTDGNTHSALSSQHLWNEMCCSLAQDDFLHPPAA